MTTKVLLAGVAAVALGMAFCVPVRAQQATSQSASGSRAVAIVKNGGGGGTAGNQVASNNTTSTIRNVPDMAIGFAGANSCAVGGGASGAGAGIGVSFVFSSEADDCKARAWAIFMAELGIKTGDAGAIDWARRIACTNETVAKTAPAGVCQQPASAVAVSSLGGSGVWAHSDACGQWREALADPRRRDLPAADVAAARQACGL